MRTTTIQQCNCTTQWTTQADISLYRTTGCGLRGCQAHVGVLIDLDGHPTNSLVIRLTSMVPNNHLGHHENRHVLGVAICRSCGCLLVRRRQHWNCNGSTLASLLSRRCCESCISIEFACIRIGLARGTTISLIGHIIYSISLSRSSTYSN